MDGLIHLRGRHTGADEPGSDLMGLPDDQSRPAHQLDLPLRLQLPRGVLFSWLRRWGLRHSHRRTGCPWDSSLERGSWPSPHGRPMAGRGRCRLRPLRGVGGNRRDHSLNGVSAQVLPDDLNLFIPPEVKTSSRWYLFSGPFLLIKQRYKLDRHTLRRIAAIALLFFSHLIYGNVLTLVRT